MEGNVKIQQSRQYAQAFGRGVYDDILRWGDSEMLRVKAAVSVPASLETLTVKEDVPAVSGVPEM